MKNILILSEDFVKTNTELSDNYWGKFLLPSIRDMQDIYLQQCLGTNLYNSVLNKIANNELDGYYKELVEDYARWYLLHLVVMDALVVANTKVGNIGAVHSRDEQVTNLTDAEIDRLGKSHDIKANHYLKRMQEFLIENKSEFPELDSCTCEGMKANLKAAADCGIWLGGARGYKLRPTLSI